MSSKKKAPRVVPGQSSTSEVEQFEQANLASKQAEETFERAIELGIKALPKNQRHAAQWVRDRKREATKLHKERDDWDQSVEKAIGALGLDVIMAFQNPGCRYECIAFDPKGKLVHLAAHFDLYAPEKMEPEEISVLASVEWAAKMEVVVDFELDASSHSEEMGEWYRLIASELESWKGAQ